MTIFIYCFASRPSSVAPAKRNNLRLIAHKQNYSILTEQRGNRPLKEAGREQITHAVGFRHRKGVPNQQNSEKGRLAQRQAELQANLAQRSV